MNHSGSVPAVKSFVGGAEAARRAARKRPQRIDVPGSSSSTSGAGKKTKKHRRLYTNPFELFFQSLLVSDPDDLRRSNTEPSLCSRVYNEALQMTGLPVIISPLPSTFKSANQYYSMKASLVLEEARFTLSERLNRVNIKEEREKKQMEQSGRRRFNSIKREDEFPSMNVVLVSVEMKRSAQNAQSKLQLTFENSDTYANGSTSFSVQDLYHLKPGCVCRLSCFSVTYLGFIQPVHKFDNGKGASTVTLLVCRFQENTDKMPVQRSRWKITFVANLIDNVRQFEACVRYPMVAFMPQLLGWKDRVHIRFDEDGDPSDIDDTARKSHNNVAGNGSTRNPYILSKTDGEKLGLNPTQMKGICEYINSEDGSLTVIQGPPGTGKTTFLVSLLYEMLYQHSFNESVMCASDEEDYNADRIRRRVMVSAPTNRAVTVVAGRFLNKLEEKQESTTSRNSIDVNVVLIGVKEKLLTENNCRNHSSNNSKRYQNGFCIEKDDDPNDIFYFRKNQTFQRIFVYTWMETFLEEWTALETRWSRCLCVDVDVIDIDNDSDDRKDLRRILKSFKRMVRRFQRSLPGKCKEFGLDSSLGDLLSSTVDHPDTVTQSSCSISKLLKNIVSCGSSTAIVEELLLTADLIFCTLATAGTSVMRSTKSIDDLLVDEAAATTEPELCIPFHLKPKRLMVVGDPQQLPPTVQSAVAQRLGLSKSLHERLMVDCARPFTMLDVQYRMRPEISNFPSHNFYGGRIKDGDNVKKETYRGSNNVFSGVPYLFLDVSGTERCYATSESFYNDEEAYVVSMLLQKLLTSPPPPEKNNNLNQVKVKVEDDESHEIDNKLNGVKVKMEDNESHSVDNTYPQATTVDYSKTSTVNDRVASDSVQSKICSSVRVITFYQGQVRRITECLERDFFATPGGGIVRGRANIPVATVDSSQGSEADVVIVSFVRDESKGGVGFLKDDRRLNVALTRAKYQLICVGNAKALEQSGFPTLQKLVEDARNRAVLKKFSVSLPSSSQPHAIPPRMQSALSNPRNRSHQNPGRNDHHRNNKKGRNNNNNNNHYRGGKNERGHSRHPRHQDQRQRDQDSRDGPPHFSTRRHPNNSASRR